MRYPYSKKRGFRRGEGERSQFAFFLVGAVVLLALAFVLGLQVGRVVEKNALKRRSEAGKTGGPIEIRKGVESEIQKDLGVFSEEAGKVPSVAPPSADEQLSETEKSVTFRETLAKKDPAPVLLTSPPPGEKASPGTPGSGSPSEGRLMIQAAAFRDGKGAEEFRRRLEKGGFHASVARSGGSASGGLHKVLVGPYPDRDAANRAIRKLKAEWKVDAFLVRR